MTRCVTAFKTHWWISLLKMAMVTCIDASQHGSRHKSALCRIISILHEAWYQTRGHSSLCSKGQSHPQRDAMRVLRCNHNLLLQTTISSLPYSNVLLKGRFVQRKKKPRVILSRVWCYISTLMHSGPVRCFEMHVNINQHLSTIATLKSLNTFFFKT